MAYLYIPKTFNADLLPLALRGQWESAAYILHRLRRGWLNWEGLTDEGLEGFIPLKSEYLQNVVGTRWYTQLRDALEEAGIIEVNHWFERGKRCKSFRLTDAYSKGGYRRIEIENQGLKDAIERFSKKENQNQLPIHKYLWNWYKQFDMNLMEAMKVIEGKKEFQDLLTEAVKGFIEKDWEFKVCDYGRVHTDVTRMLKEIRKALRYKGDHLVCIDIANSQPLFFLMYLKGLLEQQKYSSTNNNSSNTNANSNTIQYNKYKIYDSLPSQPPSVVTRQLPYYTLSRDLEVEVELYGKLVEQGQLYQYFIDAIRYPGSRDEFKGYFFKVVFYGKSQWHLSQGDILAKEFKKQFPLIWDIICQIKKKNYAVFSHLMMRIESKFVIETVCQRLMEEHPEAPILTIHDSIMTSPQYADIVRGVFNDEFAKVGITATLKVEDYSQAEPLDSMKEIMGIFGID